VHGNAMQIRLPEVQAWIERVFDSLNTVCLTV
jgi:hypothetical protein